MKRGIITIELLSDLCVSDGGAYNSLIDTDICYDDLGFPFIPAKRLRGCLRECALELKEWGEALEPSELFGSEGAMSNHARVRIGNARLKDYASMSEYVLQNKGNAIVHHQNVLNAFSYVRSQTSIDYETGVANDGSLRSMRVADRGLVFQAQVSVTGQDEDKTFTDLKKCCQVLRHMGIARTRGLGEVKVTLDLERLPDQVKEAKHAPWVEGANALSYEICLLEPVICKSVNGGEANTQDYIEGSKVLGLIAQNLKDEFIPFMNDGKVRVTNAYLSQNGQRMTEVPGFVYGIKNNSDNYVDKVCENEENSKENVSRQLSQMKHCYVRLHDGELDKADVMTQIRYHHRRPNDKSIGRADSTQGDNSNFYMMESILEGQTFAGRIYGQDRLKKVYDILTSKEDWHIGYSKTSEYGKVSIRVTAVGHEKVQKVQAKKICVTLTSPSIVYGEKAMATIQWKELVKEILAALEINEEPKTVKRFLKYATLGGFNVTWNERKPTLDVFDKGTALVMEFADEVEMAVGTAWIGERNSEGYGEVFVETVTEQRKYQGDINREHRENADKKQADASSVFAERLCKPLLDSFIRNEAVKLVNSNWPKIDKVKEAYKPTVSNLLLMTKENSQVSQVRFAMEKRYVKSSETKQEKWVKAEEILEAVEKSCATLSNGFSQKYGIHGLRIDEEAIKMQLLEACLTQLKYRMHDKKAGGEKDGK